MLTVCPRNRVQDTILSRKDQCNVELVLMSQVLRPLFDLCLGFSHPYKAIITRATMDVKSPPRALNAQ